MDILVEMYHKLTMFLVMGREGTARDGDVGLEAQASTVAVATMDTMNKVDVKVKVSADSPYRCMQLLNRPLFHSQKLMSQTCKELDALARQVIREELASIDPVMARELGLLDGRGGQSHEAAIPQMLD